ncbi:MAG: ABC transporter permease [candidate division Zixibacteria bacterium]|nr:ABC transporter permease [candidate division Zixibacteria bacterium]
MTMMDNLRIIAAVVRREARLVASSRTITTIVILAPLFFSLFYGTIYLRKGENQIAVVVVDEDRSQMSLELIRNLDGHQMMAVMVTTPDLETGRHKFRMLDAHAVVYIPSGFQRSLARGEGADLKVYLNASRFLVANDVYKAVTEVAATIGAGVRLRFLQSHGYSLGQAMGLIEPLRLDLRSIYNSPETYGDFLLPGVLVLILQQTLLFGLAQSIGREREKKMLAELLQVAGGLWRAMIGKGMFYLLLFCAYAFFAYVVLFPLFNLPLNGNIAALAAVTLLFLLAVVACTLLVGTFFPTELSAFQATLFTSYPIFFFTGYSWPLLSMPWLLKGVAVLLPTTPYLQAVSRLGRMGGSWGEIWPQAAHLAVLLIVATIGAWFLWRRMLMTASDTASA